jgi:hypothetical protein
LARCLTNRFFKGFSNDALHACIDLSMGVLARYDGFVVENDRDRPVSAPFRPIER